MPTDGHFEEFSKKADLFGGCRREDEARSLLLKGRQEATEVGNGAFQHYFSGELAYLSKDFTTAIQEELQAANLAPSNQHILSSVAIVYCMLGKYKDAVEWSTRSLALDKDNTYALRSHSYSLLRSRRLPLSISFARKAVELDPNDPSCHRTLGMALLQAGEYREALRSVRKAIRIRPSFVAAKELEAIVLGLSGKKALAVTKLRKLLAQAPQAENLKPWLFRFEDDVRALEMDAKRSGEQRERLLKLDAWRSLSARTAHRIGNQVFAAKGAIHELRSLATPTIEEQIRDIEASHVQIQRICDEFRQFSTDQKPVFKTTDVNLLVQEALRRIQSASSQLTISPPAVALVPECKWDQNQIIQALSELLENAVHHTPPGGRISVGVEPIGKGRQSWVRISIENTGEGVPASIKKRIFDPFFTTRPGGTGLGLAIVEHTIANHKGTIIENGVPDECARFVIEIPAEPFKAI
jgi:signal transduction histidine kinase